MVFGKVVSGVDTLVRMDKTPHDEYNHPFETNINIVKSGVLYTEPYAVSKGSAEVRNNIHIIILLHKRKSTEWNRHYIKKILYNVRL